MSSLQTGPGLARTTTFCLDEVMSLQSARGEEFREDQRHLHRSLAPDVLDRLTTIDARKATLSIIKTVAILATAIGLAGYFWTPWAVVPLIIVIAGGQQACFVLAHEAAHYRLYRSRWLNELVGRTMGAMVGVSMCTYRVLHRLHHNNLYRPEDPDIPLVGGYPRGTRYLLRKLATDLAGLTAHKTYAYFFGAPVINEDTQQVNRPLNDTSRKLRRAARLDRWLVVGVQIVLLAGAVSLGVWVEYLVLWVLPAVTVLQGLLRFRAICEHGAVADPNSPLTAARTNFAPWWLEWWLFPHHVNYHLEHHLYPAIPHYHLPDCHAALEQLGVLKGAEVRRVGATARLILADPVAPTLPEISASNGRLPSSQSRT